MKRISAALLCGCIGLATTPAWAGKVNLAKEGNFEFDFCLVGETRVMTGGDKVYVSHYTNTANLHTDPPGRPFDRMSSLCFGTFASLNGKPQDFGVCELTDADGDKWWMEYHSTADGAGGTYTAAHGTGKYDGVTIKGQYVLDFWPAAAKDTFQACNHNKGSWKLK